MRKDALLAVRLLAVALALICLCPICHLTDGAEAGPVSRLSQLLRGAAILKSGHSQSDQQRHLISLHQRQIDVRVEPSFNLNTYLLKKRQFLADIPASLLDSGGVDQQQQQSASSLAIQPIQMLVQLSDSITREQVESALGTKLENHFYVPNNAFAVLIKPSQLDSVLPSLLQQGTLSWAGHFSPEFKTLLSLQDRDSAPPDVRDVKLSVILNAQPSEIDALVQTWQSRFTSTFGHEYAIFSRVSDKKVLVEASGRVAGSVQRVLQAHEQVHWIERKLPMEIKNRFAHSILQAGSGTDSNLKPIWDHGITGLGQVVGVGDTGIDHDNCFFDDPLQPLPVNTVNTQHRKIISYNTVTVTHQGTSYTTDTHDGVDGHGTHVVGSVAGAISQWSSNFLALGGWNGSAPDAKIVFHDFQNLDISEGLLIPDDLNQVFSPAYDAGARIHSNSWGCSIWFLSCAFDCICKFTADFDGYHRGDLAPSLWCLKNFGQDCCRICNGYDTQTLEIDEFAFSNPDFLILFANGNDGETSSFGNLGAPAACKNCLSVGASQTANSNFLLTSSYTDIQDTLNSIGFSSESECCSFVYPSNKLLEKRVKLACCRSFMLTEYQDSTTWSHNNIASFSSKGPTFDNRIKPDVVAPGNVVHSMHSDGNPNSHQCGIQSPNLANDAAILAMSGTSMATPLTAGVVSLVRQYFVDGFYPSGHRNVSDSLLPTAALLKAMIVHSAQKMTGKVMMGDGTPETLSETPNKHEGFGLINLNKVLYFDDNPTFNLFIEPSSSLKEDEVASFCFRSTSSSAEFKATLIWFDPAPSPSSSRVLVNDLDLFVNHNSKFHYANGGIFPDWINTVEQIRVSDVKLNETVSVYVRGSSITNSKQSYSLVVTGGTFATDCIAPPLELPNLLVVLEVIVLSIVVLCCCCCALVCCLVISIFVLIGVGVRKLLSRKSSKDSTAFYQQMPELAPFPEPSAVTVVQPPPSVFPGQQQPQTQFPSHQDL